MTTTFTKLNEEWNAAPNGDEPKITIAPPDLVFEFLLNDLQYSKYRDAQHGILRFFNCWRYRLGETNDEGWYRGQCRFSRLAPSWGEFYEVRGDLLLDVALDPKAFYIKESKIQLTPYSLDWVILRSEASASHHFLFYLRDQTFECDASDWEFSVKWQT